MTSYLRKYVTALASAKDYVAEWSYQQVFADKELIVPFPTLAIYDPDKEAWTVHVNAWVYIPFQPKPISRHIPALPNFITGKNGENKNKSEGTTETIGKTLVNKSIFTEETEDESTAGAESTSNDRVDREKRNLAALVNKDILAERKENASDEDEGDDTDDIYENALRDEFGEEEESPGRLGLFFVGSSVKTATKSIINGVEHLFKPSDESGFIEEDLEFSTEDLDALCKATHDGSGDRKFQYHIQRHAEDEKKSKQDDNEDEEKPEKDDNEDEKKSKEDDNGDEEKPKKDDNDDGSKGFECTIYVLANNGISIISDIDDTIKKSNVLNKTSLLKHTFYSYFKPIEGMNELYQKWHKQKCQFHYVSASPWQLYPALRSFIEKYKFPMGTVDLRRFSWSLKFLRPADMHKVGVIVRMISSYPERKYVCIGDSGELDPEIYAKVYLQYPEAVAHILIRDICPTKECSKSCKERYANIFEEVPKDRYTIFKESKELPEDIYELLPGEWL